MGEGREDEEVRGEERGGSNERGWSEERERRNWNEKICGK